MLPRAGMRRLAAGNHALKSHTIGGAAPLRSPLTLHRMTSRLTTSGAESRQTVGSTMVTQSITSPSQPSADSIPSSSRAHSSHAAAALHQTHVVHTPGTGETSSISADVSQIPNDDAYFGALRLPSRNRKTRLPNPLPASILEQRSRTLRRLQGSRPGSVVSPYRSPSGSLEDLTSATLTSINAHEQIYPSNFTVEHVSILRACLTTGLIQRAHKVFSDLRVSALAFDGEVRRQSEKAAVTKMAKADLSRTEASVLDISMYNAMLSAYLRKAWQEQDSTIQALWLQRAWDLLTDMEGIDKAGKLKRSVDARPNEGTFVIFSKGIVRLMLGQRYPSKSRRTLGSLLSSMRRCKILPSQVILSETFAYDGTSLENVTPAHKSREGEPDRRLLLQIMMTAASDLGESTLLTDLASADRILSQRAREAKQEGVHEGEKEKSIEGSAMAIKSIELLPVRTRKTDQDRRSDDVGASQVDDDVSVANNLRLLQENLSFVEQSSRETSDRYERQRWLEFSAVEAARKRFDLEAKNMRVLGLHNDRRMAGKHLQQWMWTWYSALEKVLESEMDRMKKVFDENEGATQVHSNDIEAQIYPFLKLVPTSTMAMITVLELVRQQGANSVVGGMKTVSALIHIGRQIETESFASELLKIDQFYANRAELTRALNQESGSSNQHRNRLRQKYQAAVEMSGNAASANWTHITRARVGGFLVNRLIGVAKVQRSGVDRDGVQWDEEQPAFYSTYQYIQGKRLGVIKLNDVVANRLSSESVPFEVLSPRNLPMLVPPNPWLTHESGGYLSVKSPALRFKEASEQGSYLKQASDDGHLDMVFAGLDVLGSTAWSINSEIYEVMAHVWNSGKDIADMPALEIVEQPPDRPDDYDTDIRSRASYLKKMKYYALRKASMHSQRCDINYKLEIARAFLGERFYLPHNMDFRGRAYPIPPHLNHIGNDLCRGLMLFAEGKPLGSTGVRWLRIHLANVYGFDKASLLDREQFAIQQMDTIRACAREPLNEANDWWLRADDPWQCLAACKELTRAMEHAQGPEAYISHLPVHQDGTCNGLQHYAALGGDLNGAKQVNLSGGDRPADVYTGVAGLVIKAMEVDAADDVREAIALKGKVTRKVVKQTVMTTVYGVTFIGAKDQVMKQLADRGDVPADELWACASYLAKKILSCIGDLFSGAEAIQEWLTRSAQLISKSIPASRLESILSAEDFTSKTLPARMAAEQMTTVIWTTPLGLPVVQPYRKIVRRQVMTAMQSVFLNDPQLTTQVSSQKQANAFPPNFVHSLDATHMFMTALECQNVGLTFASVHDSYWTHACDISIMSDVIRDTFVRLHKLNVLSRVRSEFLERYKDHYVPNSALRSGPRKAARLPKSAGTKGDRAMKKVIDDKLGITHGITEPAEEDAEDEDAEEDSQTAAENGQESEADGVGSSSSALPKIPHFTPLVDALPPLPAKGAFDVDEIRRSLYFFS